MPKIHVLEKHVAELIAAGEVVERPASVAKELVENTVDAGATAVTVEIKHGGIPFLRVTDNGCGMVREDVPLAFLRHATSKVQGKEDLAGIHTLGFRGEALASIAAVSHVELLTRTANDLAGTRYLISGGDEEGCEDAGCAQGTTFVVRDLFYNTPARMKFLKKDVTEGNAVSGVVDHEALAHPEIAFRFLRDGKETLHTPGDNKLKNAIFAVYSREFTQGLLPVRYELNGVKVWGYISKPVASRPNRSMQNFFFNGRYVRSRTAMVAMEEAFKGSLMVGRFPACVLHIQLAFSAVDVNVHPSKMEIRFMNERPVFEAVYHGVKTALQKEDTPSILKLQPQPQKPTQVIFPTPVTGQQMHLQPQRHQMPAVHDSVTFADIPAVPADKVAVPPPIQTTAAVPPANEPTAVESDLAPQTSGDAEEKPQKLIGEAFGTYILVQQGDDEIRIVDKHAAHERMLYEQLKAQTGDLPQQMLLSPITVTLSKEEYTAVLEHTELLARAGFDIEDFGPGTVLVRSAPVMLQENISSAVEEMAGYLAENRTSILTEKLDWLYHNIACRAAVKAGDESTPEELLELVRRLEKEDVRYCPHGRPVSIVLRRKDLEHQFGRI
ncbi:DNA mismatch repair protein MutL [Ruminococcaceae bacterium CPB6]|uniref:DNA mismatch repair protein MutL n=1 Tax=Caproicibacterium lactatifermentans TaxID=2666138 RepID=A0A859DRM0_9FIRM|nr:DNA mismatch repair endonuclease MutL [Caproicibacterium lactatifermentans]ARP50172.1 DNA mismatch repair protein MutL [Ruminococcaceae bacterium CPB6]MDD4807951.1 DNA mismatch repair endonuclease MutL [Oscillospiraceae bacterium]QKN24105.1 DNA mismatch repair endonuclease MutL [Caproicibacterium lactatifermentans]